MSPIGNQLTHLKRFMFYASLVWSLLILASLFWNLYLIRDQAEVLAEHEARANWNKDLAFRRWATRHGGLYVKTNKRTPPSPYLAHLPYRDVETLEGIKLTLMNPAYMMSQMTHEFEDMYGIKGKITGQILLNPKNKADAWELRSLKKFDMGIKETVEISDIDGDTYLRFMKPMIMREGCMLCHGHLGFKVGDIRGGVSISIPLKPYLQSAQSNKDFLINSHSLIWILGLLGIAILHFSFKQKIEQKYQVELELDELNTTLEDKVVARTLELEDLNNKISDISRSAGMAEIVSGVLHNIGNILNSINISASIANDKINHSKSKNIARVSKLINDNRTCLCDFFENHEQGKLLPDYLALLSQEVTDDNKEIKHELDYLISNIDHIKAIIKSQQDYAGGYGIIEKINIVNLIDDALKIQNQDFNKNHINVIKNHTGITSISTNKHKLLQIIVNFISNAKHALMDSSNSEKNISITTENNESTLTISIADTGIGITEADMKHLFEYGFTRKIKGHGFGLHHSAIVANELKGEIKVFSDGPEKGAEFKLTIPIDAEA